MPRSNCVLFAILLCLVWAAHPTAAAAQGPPHDLRCQKATAPRGVKAAQPELSWVLNPGVAQRAYQILVASSEKKLEADEGDLWDSGRVLSDQATARYRGKPLSSLQLCYWKVRVWSVFHQASRYSEPANWQMGVLFFDEREAK